MTKLGYTILYVNDVAKSVAFYEAAFGFQPKFITPENDYAEMITGGTTLSFASITLANTNLKNGFLESNLNNKPFGIELGIITPHVAEAIEKAISVGATILEPAVTKPWGQVVGYIRDIDGFLIEICTPMAP